MGRLRADPGEKHEPRVAISSPVEKQYLYFRRLPIPQTGALAAAESGLRLLTQAAIEKRTLKMDPYFPTAAIRLHTGALGPNAPIVTAYGADWP
jgi:hypothetical protein